MVDSGMNRYSKGKIYKIVDIGYNKMYIGSTVESLSKRMERHRTYYKRYLETGRVDTRVRLLFEQFGIENCKIELIENYPCNTKEELQRKEEHIKMNDCVNKQVAGRTQKEYKELYKEYFKQKQKERYEENKETIKQKSREYWHNHIEKRHTYQKQHYQENKDEINKKRREERKFVCECGGICVQHQKHRHFRSQKHQDWLKQQEE